VEDPDGFTSTTCSTRNWRHSSPRFNFSAAESVHAIGICVTERKLVGDARITAATSWQNNFSGLAESGGIYS
jgi:hypothetical protein